MTHLNQMPQIISKDVNTEEKNVNIDNVNSRNVNNNNVNCTDKSHQDKVLINCRNISRTGQEGSYCHLERYCHVCRVAESGVDKFEMCLLLQQKLPIKMVETA